MSSKSCIFDERVVNFWLGSLPEIVNVHPRPKPDPEEALGELGEALEELWEGLEKRWKRKNW